MVISKYRPFHRNIDSLGFTSKNKFFMVISQYRPFPRYIDSLGITAKTNFLGKNQFFQGDLKLSSFFPKY